MSYTKAQVAEAEFFADMSPNVNIDNRSELIAEWLTKIVGNKIHREKSLKQFFSPEQIKMQLITISIDKNLSELDAIEIQQRIIKMIRQAKYKCMGETRYVFEYFGKSGWNPHIHMVCDKNKTDGQLAQLIRRKLKKVSEAYNIDVLSLDKTAADNYIEGNKAEDKMDDVKRDRQFRERYNVDEIGYILATEL